MNSRAMNPMKPGYKYPYDYDHIMETNGAQLFLLRESFRMNDRRYVRNEEVFEDKLEEYGLTRAQVQRFFEEQFRHIRMFDSDEFQDEIKDCLSEMQDEGFDFLYSCDPELVELFFDEQDQESHHRPFKTIFRPHCHLKMTCKNCPLGASRNNGRKGDSYPWTTSKGTIRIRFKAIHLREFNERVPHHKQKVNKALIDKLRTPYMVMFDVKVYSMKCKGPCDRYGSVFMYEPWVKYYCSVLCLRIYEDIVGVKPINRKVQKQPDQVMLKDHQSHLCEACADGVCDILTSQTISRPSKH